MNEPVRFRMADMSPKEAASFLRNMAETADRSHFDWNKFEEALEIIILSAMEAGRKFGERGAAQESGT